VLLLHLKTLLRQLLLPPNSLLLLGFVGLLIWQRRPRLARALIAFVLGSIWLLSTPAIATQLMRLAQQYPPVSSSQLSGAQAIVVIGGGDFREFAPEYGGPAAGGELLEKIGYAAYLARRTRLPILVSGFEPETAAMRATLRQEFDIEPRWVDSEAYDTFENARNSARQLKHDAVERILLITSADHMHRSVEEFTAAGLSVVAAPVGTRGPHTRNFMDYVPRLEALGDSYQSIYELLGEAVRRFLAFSHLRRQ
jgi:uncharacterized SAM-binding protein YcdF (DUF218 family)